MLKVTLNGVTFSVPDESRIIVDDGSEAVDMSAIDVLESLKRTNPIAYPPPFRGKNPNITKEGKP